MLVAQLLDDGDHAVEMALDEAMESHDELPNARLAAMFDRGGSYRTRQRRRSAMSARLQVTHKAIGAEVRRGTYQVIVDGIRVGSVDMNDTFETSVEPGRHTLQVRSGRNSSRPEAFDAAEGDTIAFRCTGKNLVPIFLLSFIVPRLALTLRRE